MRHQIILMTILLASQPVFSQDDDSIGRYIIVQTKTTLGGGESHTPMLLDTKTGASWSYILHPEEGLMGWILNTVVTLPNEGKDSSTESLELPPIVDFSGTILEKK